MRNRNVRHPDLGCWLQRRTWRPSWVQYPAVMVDNRNRTLCTCIWTCRKWTSRRMFLARDAAWISPPEHLYRSRPSWAEPEFEQPTTTIWLPDNLMEVQRSGVRVKNFSNWVTPGWRREPSQEWHQCFAGTIPWLPWSFPDFVNRKWKMMSAHSLRLTSVTSLDGRLQPSNTNIGVTLAASSTFTIFTQ